MSALFRFKSPAQLCVLLLAWTALPGVAQTQWWLDEKLVSQLYDGVDHFAGKARGSYIFPNKLVAEQIRVVLGGPPEARRVVVGAGEFFAAARYHSGDEKAAVLMNEKREVYAAALIHFSCVRALEKGKEAGRREVECGKQPKLTIFDRAPLAPAAKAAFVDWAQGHDGRIEVEERALK